MLLATILPTVLKAKSQGLLFEIANPRHGHEWETIRDLRALIPDDKLHAKLAAMAEGAALAG